MISISDETGKFSQEELKTLIKFLIERCRTRTEDIAYLNSIIIRRDGPTEYEGYWKCSYYPEKGVTKNFQADIILNSTWLWTIEQMKKTLSHEYGHHWTLGYLFRQGRISEDKPEIPLVYYRMRRLKPVDFNADNKDWEHRDSEVLAEDYRFLFSPYNNEHRMSHLICGPSSEVKDYIGRFGHPVCP